MLVVSAFAFAAYLVASLLPLPLDVMWVDVLISLVALLGASWLVMRRIEGLPLRALVLTYLRPLPKRRRRGPPRSSLLPEPFGSVPAFRAAFSAARARSWAFLARMAAMRSRCGTSSGASAVAE